MTNNLRITVFIIPLMLFLCVQSGYSQINATHQSTSTEEVTTQVDLSSENQTETVQTNTLPMILLGISLALNIILLIGAIYFYKELKNLKSKRKQKKGNVSKPLLIEGEEDSKQDDETAKKIKEYLVSFTPELTKNVLNQIKEKLPAILSDIENKNSSLVANDMPKLLYATAVNGENAKFFSTAKDINEEIVYRLEIDEKNIHKANFIVEKKAHQWILKCPEYLENGCELQNTGSMQVINEEAGIAEQKSDGSWYVTKKAKVKFI